jgi:GNAT superfamily N-acetyltransferase
MIRNLEKRDYLQFIKLINTNVSESDFQEFVSTLEPTKHIIIIFEEGDKIIATGTLFIERKLTYNISFLGHIENVFVDECYRSKGIGKQIVSYLINYAIENKCYRTDLACYEELIPFYEEFGFTKRVACMTLLHRENFK